MLGYVHAVPLGLNAFFATYFGREMQKLERWAKVQLPLLRQGAPSLSQKSSQNDPELLSCGHPIVERTAPRQGIIPFTNFHSLGWVAGPMNTLVEMTILKSGRAGWVIWFTPILKML